jgi:hypothetical protein
MSRFLSVMDKHVSLPDRLLLFTSLFFSDQAQRNKNGVCPAQLLVDALQGCLSTMEAFPSIKSSSNDQDPAKIDSSLAAPIKVEGLIFLQI